MRICGLLRWLDVFGLSVWKRHAAGCAGCRARLAREQDLEERLRAEAITDRAPLSEACRQSFNAVWAMSRAHKRRVWSAAPAFGWRLGARPGVVLWPALGALVLVAVFFMRGPSGPGEGAARKAGPPDGMVAGLGTEIWAQPWAGLGLAESRGRWVELAGGWLQTEAELTLADSRRLLGGMVESVWPAGVDEARWGWGRLLDRGGGVGEHQPQP
jgi:hypothetical protein